MAMSRVLLRMRSGSWVEVRRVVVDDAIDRVAVLLERDVVAERAQVIAQVRQAGRLDAGEDAVRSRGNHRAGSLPIDAATL